MCNRSFGYKHVLQNHERTHTGEKPFECLQCHKRFTRDHHLKTHMRLHTGEKPYSCTHCERQFVQVANLRRHLRVHTGEKPYACEMCSSRFSDSNQLKAHVLIHKGEKPFACELCGGRFRRRHHLEHHKCNASAASPLPPAAAAAAATTPATLDLRVDPRGPHQFMDGDEDDSIFSAHLTPPSSARKGQPRAQGRTHRPQGRAAAPAPPVQTEPEDLSVRRADLADLASTPSLAASSPPPWSDADHDPVDFEDEDDEEDLVDATFLNQHQQRRQLKS